MGDCMIDTLARLATLLFLLAGCIYAARTALRLDDQVPSGSGRDLTKEQQDAKDAVQLLTALAVAFGLALLAFGIWWMAKAGGGQ